MFKKSTIIALVILMNLSMLLGAVAEAGSPTEDWMFEEEETIVSEELYGEEVLEEYDQSVAPLYSDKACGHDDEGPGLIESGWGKATLISATIVEEGDEDWDEDSEDDDEYEYEDFEDDDEYEDEDSEDDDEYEDEDSEDDDEYEDEDSEDDDEYEDEDSEDDDEYEDEDSESDDSLIEPDQIFDQLEPEERTLSASGVIGNIRWSYHQKWLYLSGTGEMADYSVRSLKERPWAGKDIKHVYIAEGISHVGNYAFYGMNVRSLTLPASVSSIGEGAFRRCAFTSLDLPGTVQVIGNGAFANIPYLDTVGLGEGIKQIDAYAFGYCTKVHYVRLPASLTRLAGNAFLGSTSLYGIDVAEGSKEYQSQGGIVYDHSLSRIVAVPNGKSGFCTIPSGVRTVGSYAFSQSRYADITLPDTLRFVEDSAFEGCQAKEVLFKSIHPLFGDRVFANCKPGLVLKGHDDTSIKRYAVANRLLFKASEGHDHQTLIVVKDATCTQPGEARCICSDCGLLIEEKVTIPPTGHCWGEGRTVTEPTCSHAGCEAYSCDYCSQVKYVRLPLKPHTWESQCKVDQLPTCKKAGRKSIHCSVCGVSNQTTIQEIPKLEHIWELDVENSCPADCEEDGERCFVCKRCQEEKSEVIPKTGHKWITIPAVPATVFREGLTAGKKCAYCEYESVESVEPEETDVLDPVLKLSKTKLTLARKQSYTVKVTQIANGDSVKSWKSSNEKIATVKNGVITAKSAPGKATITVTLASKKKATIAVTVKHVTTTKITVSKTSLTLKKGASETLTVTRKPYNSEDKVTYKSSNAKVAAVSSSGKITAKKAGKATITITSGKYKATVKVTVK